MSRKPMPPSSLPRHNLIEPSQWIFLSCCLWPNQKWLIVDWMVCVNTLGNLNILIRWARMVRLLPPNSLPTRPIYPSSFRAVSWCAQQEIGQVSYENDPRRLQRQHAIEPPGCPRRCVCVCEWACGRTSVWVCVYMYLYIYMYTYVCMYTNVAMHTYIYIYISLCVYICMYL